MIPAPQRHDDSSTGPRSTPAGAQDPIVPARHGRSTGRDDQDGPRGPAIVRWLVWPVHPATLDRLGADGRTMGFLVGLPVTVGFLLLGALVGLFFGRPGDGAAVGSLVAVAAMGVWGVLVIAYYIWSRTHPRR